MTIAEEAVEKRLFNAEAWRASGQTEHQRVKSKRSETLTNEDENEVCLAECEYFCQGAKRMAQDLCNRNVAVNRNLLLLAMLMLES